MQFGSSALVSLLAVSGLVAADDVYDRRCNIHRTTYCSTDDSHSLLKCTGATSASTVSCTDETNASPGLGYCWESSGVAGDAICIKDCVYVQAPNGTTFYPVGCQAKGLAPYAPFSPSTANTTSPSATPTAKLPMFSNAANADTAAPTAMISFIVVAAGMLFAA